MSRKRRPPRSQFDAATAAWADELTARKRAERAALDAAIAAQDRPTRTPKPVLATIIDTVTGETTTTVTGQTTTTAGKHFRTASPVTTRRADGTTRTAPAYDARQTRNIVKAGQRKPRTWNEVNSSNGGGNDFKR